MSSTTPAPAPTRAPDAPKRRLAVLLSHPIPYVVPLMRLLAQHPGTELSVYFMADTGLRARTIAGYGDAIKWDVPLLDGYTSEILPNRAPRPDGGGVFAKVNPEILAILARGRFDAVLLHGYSSVTEWMAYAAAKLLRIPLLFWGDVLIDSPLKNTSSPRMRAAFRHGFVHGIDAALALSTQARWFYERYGVPREHIFWAPLCVDHVRWKSEADALRPRRAELLRAMGADPERPVIAYVAHMRPNKRPKDVLQALERMRTPATLLMAGGGPMFDEVARYKEERGLSQVHLLGALNQSELPRIYAMSDVFVLPSSAGEVTPLVVQEAMWAGLPVIMSDAIPSTVDFVREGENGFTFPVCDVDALAAKLDAVLASPETTARMRASSLDVIAPWTYGVTVEAIVQAMDAFPGRRS